MKYLPREDSVFKTTKLWHEAGRAGNSHACLYGSMAGEDSQDERISKLWQGGSGVRRALLTFPLQEKGQGACPGEAALNIALALPPLFFCVMLAPISSLGGGRLLAWLGGRACGREICSLAHGNRPQASL